MVTRRLGDVRLDWRPRVITPAAPPAEATAKDRALAIHVQVLTPLCIIAAAATFVAQVTVGRNHATLSALAVVPVVAAALLCRRSLTLIVAAFALVLPVWGVAIGAIAPDEAGMQVCVYLLTLAAMGLQQSHGPLQHSLASSAGPETAALAHTGLVPSTPTLEMRGMEVPAAPRPAGGLLGEEMLAALTRREREVVRLAADGLTAREVGARLFIGERTVETHLANAYGKLGVRSKVELVKLASRRSTESVVNDQISVLVRKPGHGGTF